MVSADAARLAPDAGHSGRRQRRRTGGGARGSWPDRAQAQGRDRRCGLHCNRRTVAEITRGGGDWCLARFANQDAALVRFQVVLRQGRRAGFSRSRSAPERRSDPKVSVHSSNGKLLVISVSPRLSRYEVSSNKCPAPILLSDMNTLQDQGHSGGGVDQQEPNPLLCRVQATGTSMIASIMLPQGHRKLIRREVSDYFYQEYLTE